MYILQESPNLLLLIFRAFRINRYDCDENNVILQYFSMKKLILFV